MMRELSMSCHTVATQFEKLDAERPGESGGQGEYSPQTGFGWSNGVVLQLLDTYGWHPELQENPRLWVKKVSCGSNSRGFHMESPVGDD